MSPLRLQIFGIIVALALLTIVSGVGMSMYMMRDGIIRLEKESLKAVAEIADALVSSKFDTLKLAARGIALHVDHAGDDEENIKQVIRDYDLETGVGFHDTSVFQALTVLEKTVDNGKEQYRIVAEQGSFPIPEWVLLEKRKPDADYLAKAFQGHSVLSTTVKTDDDFENISPIAGFVCVPIGVPLEGQVKRILCATMDGTYFINLLNRFQIWGDNSDIILCDREGFLIASRLDDKRFVVDRINFIHLAAQHPTNREFQSLGKFFTQMTSGQTGLDIHTLSGQQRVSYHMPITASHMEWSLAVTAPVYSGPYREAIKWLTIIACICSAIGCMVAFFASGFLEKPYKEAFFAKAAAEKASASKSLFLANMSHEMRTPLNAIIGLSELAISSDEATGDVAITLEKVYNSGVTLLGIVNDLLDISKIEAGKLELIPAEYDLPSLINDTVALNSVRIGSKPIKFSIHVDENLPSRLFGDELRIKQLLNNLLTNAFKYTKEGHVNWSITGKHEGNHFYLVFAISDTGIGIRQDDMSMLFVEYQQIDFKSNPHIEGTGLGLALVKKMADLMGGTITVQSTFGKGTSFVLQIQQKPVGNEVIGKDVVFNLVHMRHSKNKLARNAQLTRLKLPYAKVLVVDDVQTNLDVARGMLKPYEMQVDCVTSGYEAINAVRDPSIQYNAIFMDHMMPGIDGIEATKRIREIGTEYAKTVPIIALTANAIMGNEEMFLKNGFQAFLSKPIDIMRLDIEIRRWLRDKSQEPDDPLHSSANTTDSNGQPSWKIEGIDKEKALVQFGGSEETFLIVLQSYAINTPSLLEKIRAVVDAPLQDYAILVHGIKGTSYGIGADELGKQAEALEHAARHGDAQYVSEHNAELIKATEDLIDRINTTLRELGVG